MKIRQAAKEDRTQLEALGPRVCANAVRGFGALFEPAAWAEQVRDFLAATDRRMFVADDQGFIAGIHAVVACPLLFSKSAIVVRTATLWVHPNHRAKGVARDMHHLAQEWARRIGARAMFAGVPHDYAAHAALDDAAASPALADLFYRNRGYRPVETELVMEVL